MKYYYMQKGHLNVPAFAFLLWNLIEGSVDPIMRPYALLEMYMGEIEHNMKEKDITYLTLMAENYHQTQKNHILLMMNYQATIKQNYKRSGYIP